MVNLLMNLRITIKSGLNFSTFLVWMSGCLSWIQYEARFHWKIPCDGKSNAAIITKIPFMNIFIFMRSSHKLDSLRSSMLPDST